MRSYRKQYCRVVAFSKNQGDDFEEFTDDLERLDQIGVKLEKFIIKNNNLKKYKNLNFFTIKSIVNLLNNFFENASLPILTFKRYKIIDFIVDKYKTIISILAGISSLISAIVVFF